MMIPQVLLLLLTGITTQAFVVRRPNQRAAAAAAAATRRGAGRPNWPTYKEVPPLGSSGGRTSNNDNNNNNNLLLPLGASDPKLYTGKWEIKSSNDLSHEMGFGTVVIDENGSFKAIAQRKQDDGLLSSTVQVSRNGSFALLGDAESSIFPSSSSAFPLLVDDDIKEAIQQQQQQQSQRKDDVLGVLEFQADETEHLHSSIVGVGLPPYIVNRRAPQEVRDLGGKKVTIHVKIVDLDTIILLFLEKSRFYVLRRSNMVATETDVTPATPINVVLVTQILSLVASAIVEGLRSDIVHLMK